MENIKDLWTAALDKVKEQISKPSFDTWLKHTEAQSLDGNTVTVIAPNEFARDWLEGQYTKVITDIISEITGANLTVKFVIPHVNNEEENQQSAVLAGFGGIMIGTAMNRNLSAFICYKIRLGFHFY